MTNKINPKKRNLRGLIFRIGTYVLREWYLFIPAIIFTLLSNQLALMGPRYSGAAIDAITDAAGVQLDSMWENVIRMIICYAGSAILAYVLAVIMVHLGQRVVYKMRRQVFNKLLTLPVGYFDTHPTGDIISHLSYDIDTLNATLSHDLVQIMTSVYTVLGSLYFMWQISKPMLLIFAVTVPLSIAWATYRARRVKPLFRARAKKYGELNGYAEEMLSGMRTISVYGKEEVISKRFEARNTDAMDFAYKAEHQGCAMGPTMNFMNNLSLSLVAMFGGILYMLSVGGKFEEGALFFITLGGIAQFVQYSRKFVGPINEFANIMHEFQSAFSAAERIFAIIDEEPETADVENPTLLPNPEGNVEIRDVCFGYTPERMILKDFSVKADAGRTVAIVGPTGAGKTTVINLLMRFYDVNSGEIRLDSVPIREMKRSEVRGAYTMVLQDSWLFSGTIFENIIYGKENATREEVMAAARAARISSYVESLPDGYDTHLSDGGNNISKGQRQLITIARAILSDAPMLILDEATSNVDSRTEIQIQKALATLMQGRTSFVIAHRLSTVQNADVILVVKDGQIAESGTHAELLSLGGFYSKLYNSQFS